MIPIRAEPSSRIFAQVRELHYATARSQLVLRCRRSIHAIPRPASRRSDNFSECVTGQSRVNEENEQVSGEINSFWHKVISQCISTCSSGTDHEMACGQSSALFRAGIISKCRIQICIHLDSTPFPALHDADIELLARRPVKPGPRSPKEDLFKPRSTLLSGLYLLKIVLLGHLLALSGLG